MKAHFTRIRSIFTALICVVVMCTVSPVSAALSTPASDTLTRLKVGVAADHTIVFKTPTGIDASTDTVVITMPGFVFGGLTIGDITLSWGAASGFEQATSIAAFPAAGVWGATIVGTTITFTAPTDSVPGSIPAGQFLGVRVGANAGGVNRLMNPASPINTQIEISGTFGDTATTTIPIVSDDTVVVTAVVPTSGGGGSGSSGGGGEPPPVVGPVPPVISDIQVINITNTTARVTWNTDTNADSSVSYGFTVAYASGTVSNGSLGTSHIVDLSGLTPNTSYRFIVSSTDASSLVSTSGDGTFTTLGAGPVISNVQVVNITDSSALVTWDTDVPASSDATYGPTIAYGSTALTPGLVTSHAVQLNGLLRSTLYHFFVTSIDASSNAASGADGTFTTLADVTPPTNAMDLTATPGDTIVSLSWTNPTDPDLAGTKITRKTGDYPLGPFDGTQVYAGPGNTTIDTGLTNDVLYYYGAYAYDTSGNLASGALASAMPTSVPILPTPTSTPPVTPPVPEPTPTPTPTPTPITTPVPVPVPTPGGTIISVTAEYFGNGGALLLTPDANGMIGILSGTSVFVRVPVAGLGAIPSHIELHIGNAIYSLQKNADGTAWTGTFTAPSPAVYDAAIAVSFEGGGVGVANAVLNVKSAGQVVEETLLGPSAQAVPAAIVQLFREVGGVWQPYGTQQTSVEGAFGFVVPNGRYYAEVTKDGYRKAVSVPINVTNNVFNDRVSLIKVPVSEPLPEAPVARIVAITQLSAQAVSYGIKIAREFLQSPAVQTVSSVTLPLMIALTIANVASAVSLFNLLAYLQYLFTQPVLLFGRRKKRKWGVVFNSLTKQPIDLAIVRLVHFETHLVVQTKVTDGSGRYVFTVKKGNYQIEVVKPGYVFPTTYLSENTEDVDFSDLYHGGKLEFDTDQTIALNIPLDPVTREETPRRVLLRKFLRRLRHSVAFSGVLLGMVVLVVTPTIVSALLLMAQIGVYLLFRRLALPSKAKSWGITFDAKTRKPLGGVIVRIFDKKFNKLLEMQITDQNGKYGFFVRRNVYYLVAQKQGYEKYTSQDIDLSGKDEAIIDQNLPLSPSTTLSTSNQQATK